jgi:hypothetical protein
LFKFNCRYDPAYNNNASNFDQNQYGRDYNNWVGDSLNLMKDLNGNLKDVYDWKNSAQHENCKPVPSSEPCAGKRMEFVGLEAINTLFDKNREKMIKIGKGLRKCNNELTEIKPGNIILFGKG